MLRFALTVSILTPASLAQSWQEITPSIALDRAILDLEVDPTNAAHLAVVQPSAPLLESLDGGMNWRVVDLPSPPNQPAGTPELPLSCAFDSEGQLYVAVAAFGSLALPRQLVYRRQAGVFTLFGPAAEPQPLATEYYGVVAMGQADQSVMAVGFNDSDGISFASSRLHGSTDGGSTWTPWPVGNGSIYDLSVQQSPGGTTVFAATADELVQTGPEPRIVRIDPATGNGALLAGTFRERLELGHGRAQAETLVLMEGSGFEMLPLARSLDGGATFTSFADAGYFVLVARGQVNPDFILRARVSNPFQFNRTTIEATYDGGLTWQVLGGAELFVPVSELVVREDDGVVYAFGGKKIFRINTTRDVGAVECSTLPNSTGKTAKIALAGSDSIGEDDLRLWISDAPPATVGILMASTTQGFLPATGDRFGPICVGGSIGRGSFLSLGSGPHGEFFFDAQLGALPGSNGPVSAAAGQTWRFQGWFRDAIGTIGSHTSDSIAVTLTP